MTQEPDYVTAMRSEYRDRRDDGYDGAIKPVVDLRLLLEYVDDLHELVAAQDQARRDAVAYAATEEATARAAATDAVWSPGDRHVHERARAKAFGEMRTRLEAAAAPPVPGGPSAALATGVAATLPDGWGWSWCPADDIDAGARHELRDVTDVVRAVVRPPCACAGFKWRVTTYRNAAVVFDGQMAGDIAVVRDAVAVLAVVLGGG